MLKKTGIGTQTLHYLVRLFAFCIVSLFSYCANHTNEIRNITASIEKFQNEFQIAECSYLVAKNGQIEADAINMGSDGMIGEMDSILFNFTGPLFVNYLTRNSIISEADPLSKYSDNHKSDEITIKNLLEIKNNQYPQTSLSQDRNRLIRSLIDKTSSKNDFDSFVKNNLKLKYPVSTLDALLTNLEKVSKYFDVNNISKKLSKSSHIRDLYPTWYTKNTTGFYGWKILKFQNNTVLWNYFFLKKGKLLLIKDLDKNLFAGIYYDNKSFTFNNSEDLLDSPIALEIIDALYNSKYRNDLNLNSSKSEIAQYLKSAIHTPFNFIVLRKIVLYAEFLLHTGKAEQAKALFELYQNNCPSCVDVEYLDRPMLAGVKYASDNMSGIQPFTLDKKSNLKFFGVGQSKKIIDYQNDLYQFDNVELFIDLYNSKKEFLNIMDHHYIFRFNYHYPIISGNTPTQGIEFAFNDTSDTTYALEIKIPWQSLDAYEAKRNNNIGLSILVGDSDEEPNRRDRVLSLFINDINLWNQPQNYGTMILSDNTGNTKYFRSVMTNEHLKIDGAHERFWNATHFTPIQKIALGNRSSTLDTAYVKTLWDKRYIYFYFNIKDNIKNTPGVKTSDSYWIENAETGQVVWKLTGSIQPTFPTFFAKGNIVLPKGKYLLKFLTDDSHSFEGWYGVPPTLDMYGLLLYRSIEE